MFIAPKELLKHAVALCLLAALPFTLLTSEVVAGDLEKPVFEFQSKLANKGNARAQYYLAQMYEEGRGTAVDAKLAQHWYEQAKLNGYQAEEVKIAAN